jgi:hypothetical protein
MSSMNRSVQVFSIATALLGSGGLLATSFFDVPELQAQPASRSLPAIRWYFSRGSHVFPQAAALSSAGFLYLAYTVVPPGPWRVVLQNSRVVGYVAAAALTIGIAPFTSVMIPTNFEIIQMNKDLGGARSQEAAKQGSKKEKGDRSDPPDMDGKYEMSEFWDLSLPMEKTSRDSTKEEDERARELLGKFGRLNLVRAVLMLGGGVIGLVTALG